MTQTSILETRDLLLNIGDKRVLDHLSLEFWPGYVHAVVGPNGAGKSTLANAIMGLSGYTGFQGDVLFQGESVKDMPLDERGRKGITLAWQEPARYEGLKVKTFISAGTNNKSPEHAAQALERVGLDPAEYMERAVDKTLSGGERKRIELASILTMEPKLVLMDEPDSGIDVEALERIFEAIQFLRDKGVTVLMITHSMTVLNKADHAFLICCGQMVEKGSVNKIKQYFGQKCIPCDHKNEPTLEKPDEQR